MKQILCYLLVLLPLLVSAQDLQLISWNVQDMGRTTSDEELARMVDILRDADVVAIQEVVAKDPAGAQRVALLADLLDRTGANWDYAISDPTTNEVPQSRERYAFLWRTSKVTRLAYGLDKENEANISREPYWLDVRVKGFDGPIRLINFHSLPYSKHPETEIPFLADYPRRWNDRPLIYLGDWNMKVEHPCFRSFAEQGYRPALSGMPTTLKRKCTSNGAYVNHAIDNIYFNSAHFGLITAGVIDFVRGCEFLAEDRSLSDHLPVYLTIRPANL